MILFFAKVYWDVYASLFAFTLPAAGGSHGPILLTIPRQQMANSTFRVV